MEIMVTERGRFALGTLAPALCLDLDGTVRYSKSGKDFIEGPADVALFPDVEAKVWGYRDNGFIILGISNQAGVAYGFKTPAQVDAELDATFAAFERNPFHMAKMCYHHPQGTVVPWNKRSLCRKPDTGLLALCEVEAFDEGFIIDWDNSLFVGDRAEDEECARRACLRFRWASEFFEREGETNG